MGSKGKQLFGFNIGKDIGDYNIAVIGALGVGKSATVVRYITKRFIVEYDPNIEDIYPVNESVDSQEVSLRVMDTCDTAENSSERYLKWAHGIIVMYNITNRPSFDTARTYLDIISQYERSSGREISVALVGNKMDLERYRTVSKTTGQALANEFECLFHETSAAEDCQSIKVVFQDVLRDIVHHNERQVALQPLYITEDKSQTNGNGQQPTPKQMLRRPKSPKSNESIKKEALKEPKEIKVPTPRKNAATSAFKFFNKNFKLF